VECCSVAVLQQGMAHTFFRNTAKVAIVTLSGFFSCGALRRKFSEGSRFGREILRWSLAATRSAALKKRRPHLRHDQIYDLRHPPCLFLYRRVKMVLEQRRAWPLKYVFAPPAEP
jgi:hypothetical protein